jgi:hypothetical protein
VSQGLSSSYTRALLVLVVTTACSCKSKEPPRPSKAKEASPSAGDISRQTEHAMGDLVALEARLRAGEELAPNDARLGTDPWGARYLVKRIEANRFELRSSGPDRQPSTGDDVIAEVVIDPTFKSPTLEDLGESCLRGTISDCEAVANQLSISNDPGARARSVALFEMTCTKDSMLGCYAAGCAYADGKDVAKDAAKGHDLLDKGCKLGHHWSCERLAGRN